MFMFNQLVYVHYPLATTYSAGIGHSTGHRLKVLGLATVRDLQCFPSAELAREFGASTALRLQNLAQGIDNSPVTPAGPPQVLQGKKHHSVVLSSSIITFFFNLFVMEVFH